MNIQKYGIYGLYGLLGVGYMTALYYQNEITKSKNELKKEYDTEIQMHKTEIYSMAPEKYNEIINNDNAKSLKYWEQQAASIKDSLRVDSLCRKAYFEGAQMVRDSINNAQENHN